ncbi:MAG TPA: A24 family peptidase [Symbiobacteriaceae bacterium]|nr:A24 family peptidase [Symbiobacteriaceae bacterium]
MTWQVPAALALGAALGYGGGRLAPRWIVEKPMRSWEPYVLSAINGGLMALLAMAHPLDAYFWQHLIFISVLTTASLVDLHDRIIPNELVLFGLAAGGALLLLAPYPDKTWLQALIGAGAGFGFMLVLALIAPAGMGLGDVKLAAVIGLFLGFPWVGMGLVLAFLSGGLLSAVLLIARVVGRKNHIPFGPWLALGAILTILYGARIWSWYWTY